jgi:hypothetical protein
MPKTKTELNERGGGGAPRDPVEDDESEFGEY